ncbi:hypothetical protein ACOCEA_03340 [Maribacter sp. CXY002]|uniref:hypothetical protein n=1 Tax=Maribacter luteocoastalis TaxID=3407671 RepID=UPI003B6840FC
MQKDSKEFRPNTSTWFKRSLCSPAMPISYNEKSVEDLTLPKKISLPQWLVLF